MLEIIFGGILAFLVTLTVIPVIITVATRKKLYDEPDDLRKLHKSPIPSLGGLAMFVGFIFSILLTVNFSVQAPEFQFYLAAFLLIFFLGLKDDILVLSPSKKFIGQVLAAFILAYKGNLLIDNMHGLLGIGQINEIASYGLTIFSIVVIINAYNLIDGVDGLAGSLGLLSTLVFGMFFLINDNFPYAALAFSFAGSLVAFLIFNFYPARIFMGDTGSLMIGLVNSILVIKFIETGEGYSFYPVSASPALGFAILLVPLMDTLRVFAVRVINGKSPFSPDRNHIHHLLLNRGFNPKSVTITCVAVALIVGLCAFLLQDLGTGILLTSLVGAFFALVYLISNRKSRYKFRVIKGEANLNLSQETKLVTLYDNNKGIVVEEE